MFGKLGQSLKEKLAAEPIDCPRGWGSVTFPASGLFLGGIIWVGRTCPISGAENCAGCGYQTNPDALKLNENLAVLEQMRRDGTLTETEFGERRTALLTLHPEADATVGFRITAWILGPLGILFVAAGIVLARELHEGFWGLGGVGAVMLVLTISFANLARKRPQTQASDASPYRDPLR